MYLYTELLLNVLYYLLVQRHNLIARRSAAVHKHQGLAVVHTGTSKRLALPATLLYHQPAGILIWSASTT